MDQTLPADVSLTACPMCGSERRHLLFALGEADGVQREACRCGDCGFGHMSPQLTDAFLADYYGAAIVYAYGSDRPEDYAAVIGDKVTLIRRFLKAAGGAPASGLAVDYGAGVGTTVKAMEKLGFDSLGVEISARSRETAAALFHIDMRGGDLEQFDDGSVALLTMFDVMEHMLQPRLFTQQMFDKIRPGGLAMIGVPNFDSLDRMLRGVNAQVMTFPEHVNFFTRSSLVRMMETAGFEVRYVGSPPPYGVAISFGVRRALNRAFGRNAVTRGIGGVLAWLKRWLVYPLPNVIVEHSGVFGQSLFIVARKPG
ncbi:MAG: class I SAM-dependent methyltransferase [Asticcacaulis sp.]